MNEIIIRQAAVKDAEEILAVYTPYTLETAITFEYTVPSLEEFRERIRKTLERYPYYVAVQNGTIVGYAYASALKGRKAYDWSVETSIYVKKDRHKMGVGRKLYQKLEEALKQQGIRNLYACIAYTEQEDPYLTNDSMRFHAHLGYQQNALFRKCAFKYDKWYDMIWMEKMLGEHEGKPEEVTAFPDLPGIKVILWDIDGTVLNFDASERAALRKGFAEAGLGECTDEMIREYSEINKTYWQRLERGEITKNQVLEGRFEEFFAKKGLDVSLAKEFNRSYQWNLSEVICFEEGAKELIWGYRGIYGQYAASNGTAVAQRNKLTRSGLIEVLDGVFISDEIGTEKPMKGFFDAVFSKLPDVKKEEILIIGDSLTSDMKGGETAGIRTCWYNPKKQENTLGVRVDHEIQSLYEIPEILKRIEDESRKEVIG